MNKKILLIIIIVIVLIVIGVIGIIFLIPNENNNQLANKTENLIQNNLKEYIISSIIFSLID